MQSSRVESPRTETNPSFFAYCGDNKSVCCLVWPKDEGWGVSYLMQNTHTTIPPLQSATQTRATHYRREGGRGKCDIYVGRKKRGGGEN